MNLHKHFQNTEQRAVIDWLNCVTAGDAHVFSDATGRRWFSYALHGDTGIRSSALLLGSYHIEQGAVHRDHPNFAHSWHCPLNRRFAR